MRATKIDRAARVVLAKCDICDGPIPEAPDDIESHLAMLQEIDDSYESEYDKHEPRLLLCDYCTKEYQIPGYSLD